MTTRIEGDPEAVSETVGVGDGVFVSSIKKDVLDVEGAAGYDEGDGDGVMSIFFR